jgi:drug/metabolite transporter (DMT)-like permease
VPAAALALTLASALLHASWNLLIARAEDPRSATAVATVVGWLAFFPVAIVGWRVDAEVWPFVLASGAAELIYVALLASAYRRAELSVVYPVARGVAPVLVLLVAVLALGEPTDVTQVVGVAMVGAGVLLVRGDSHASAEGVSFGLAVAVSIATYTLIDSRGVTHASPAAYLTLCMAIPVLVYPATVAAGRGVGVLRAAVSPSSMVAGVFLFGAYALVLWALTLAPPAPVAAVRETGVVIATLMAARVLHERVTVVRIAGACTVVLGVALVVV